MRNMIFTLALLGAALPAAASAESIPAERFEHDGVTYHYTVTTTASGQRIRGTADTGSFELQVRKDKVSGTFNGIPVSFKLSDVKPVEGIVEIALR